MVFDKDFKGALVILARHLLYIAVCMGMMLIQHAAARHYHENTYAENGRVENMQFLLLLSSGIVFLVHALVHRKERTVLFTLSGLCALGACREMDRVLDSLIPVVSWRIGLLFVVVPCAWNLKHFEEFQDSLCRFLSTKCFVMLCTAFSIILVLGQLIGHKPYLKAVMLDIEHLGTIKEMVEESIETIGYLIILLASAESFFEFPWKGKGNYIVE